MNLTPTLLDFSSEESLIKLQNKFNSFDVNSNPLIESNFKEVKVEDFSIICKLENQEKIEEYKTIYFFEDFIKSKISTLGIQEISKIEDLIIKDFLYNNHERKNFINHQISIYGNLNSFILSTTFLNSELKVSIYNQSNIVVNYLFDDNILKTNFPENEKMKFKMNKNDIHVLFLLLRQAKIISHPHDNDLGRIIDNFFMYYDSDNNIYKEIKRSNKDINDFKNINKTFENSIFRLKKLLQDDNFYVYKP